MSDITHIGLPVAVSIDENQIIDGLDLAANLMAEALWAVAPYGDGSADLLLRLMQSVSSEVITDVFERNRQFRVNVHDIGDPNTRDRRFQAHLENMRGEVQRLLINFDQSELPLG